jgi:glycerol-3-phosphate dehydrogenase (NAD(P)+)
MAKVLMYSTGVCPFCLMAERLLRAKGVEIEKGARRPRARAAPGDDDPDRAAHRCRRSTWAIGTSAVTTTSPPSTARAGSTPCSPLPEASRLVPRQRTRTPRKLHDRRSAEQPTRILDREGLREGSFLEIPNAPGIFLERDAPQVDIQLHHNSTGVENGVYQTTLTVTVTAKVGDKTMFLVEVAQAGIFVCRNIPAQELEAVLAIACPNILFPYVREVISETTVRAGFPPVLLAPVNFEAIYQAQREPQPRPRRVACRSSRRPPRTSRIVPQMRMRCAVLVLAAVGLPAAGAEYRALGERPAILYDAPSTRADRLFVASRLYPFEVLVKLDQWSKVRDANGEVAWVENTALGSRATVLVTVPLADVRVEPNAQSALVFEAYKQVILEIVEPASGEWIRCAIATASRDSSAWPTSGAPERLKIAILGAGAWGSALATSLAAHHEVSLWTRGDAERERLARSRTSRYLPEITLPPAVRIERDAAPLAAGRRPGDRGHRDRRDCARRSPGIRAVAPRSTSSGRARVSRRERSAAHEVVAQALPDALRVGALSGPSFALEVARGQPTAIVLASREAEFAGATAAALNSARLRIYSSEDVVGVELGGALKNVIAIAAGISDGLGLGRNARAALVTRGLAEISRLGVAMGGRSETFAGLAGLGDLVLTCTGELSRNREVGVRLAQGRALDAVLSELGHVSEGVSSARAAREHSRAHAVEMPITEAVCAVLFESRAPGEAVQQLLARDPRRE